MHNVSAGILSEQGLSGSLGRAVEGQVQGLIQDLPEQEPTDPPEVPSRSAGPIGATMPTTRTDMPRSGIEGYLRGPYRPGGGGYATPTSGSRAGLPSLFITGTRKVAEVGPRAVFARSFKGRF